ncbi:hypothetical protein ACIREE_12205 [Streptomyces sp. NPDC102467]|uniref:hypothetical protein n=1 Tax=Streptomyces sp. NPDC102467 TaxID=3366179 RepID=UPI00382ECF2D
MADASTGLFARCARHALDTLADVTGALLRPVVAAVLDRIDLDAVVSRVDVNRIADRVDVERIAARVAQDRVNVNRIAERVDVDAVIARIDLVGLTRDVLREIDLGRIVRDTGGGMTVETVDAIRLLGQRGDRSVNRLADRLLGRTGPPPDTATEPPTRHAR